MSVINNLLPLCQSSVQSSSPFPLQNQLLKAQTICDKYRLILQREGKKGRVYFCYVTPLDSDLKHGVQILIKGFKKPWQNPQPSQS